MQQFYTLLKLMLEYMTPEESIRLKSFNAFYSNPSTLQNVPIQMQSAGSSVVLPPTPVPIFPPAVASASTTPGRTGSGSGIGSAAGTAGGPAAGTPTTVVVDEDSLECPICMEAKPEVVLTCTHGFCNRCLKQWYQYSFCSMISSSPRCVTIFCFVGTRSNQSPECPICRQMSSGDDGFIITDHSADVARYFQQQLETLSRQSLATPPKQG